MDIAFITSFFPKYSKTFIINQAAALLQQGHEVTVFSYGKPESPARHSIVDDYNMDEMVIYISEITDYVSGIKQLLSALTGPHSISDIVDAISYGRSGPARLASKEAIYKQKSFDILHAHFGPIARQWDFLSTLPNQGPLVATYYGYDVTEYLHPDNYDFYKKYDHWERVNLAIGISEHIRSKMIMAGCPEEITMTHPIGIDPDLFQFSPTPLQDGDKLRLVSTCRHTEKKGLEYAIRAVGRLKNKGINTVYTIAGEGKLTSQYRKTAAEVGVEDEVEFIGRMPQEQVSKLMQEAHLYIQPSVTASSGDMEGQGLVFQEAQATGTPPIATFHNGIPEGVKHAETGRLAPERDVSRLAEEVEYFVQHPDEIIQYAKRGREWVESKYDYKYLGNKQEEIYESVINEHKRTK